MCCFLLFSRRIADLRSYTVLKCGISNILKIYIIVITLITPLGSMYCGVVGSSLSGVGRLLLLEKEEINNKDFFRDEVIKLDFQRGQRSGFRSAH